MIKTIENMRKSGGDISTETGIDTLIEEIEQIATEFEHKVILFNDEYHFFDEVVLYVQLATGKSHSESFEITMEAHENGSAVCFAGDLDDCKKVAFMLTKVDLTVELD